jgi:hypothetical protein
MIMAAGFSFSAAFRLSVYRINRRFPLILHGAFLHLGRQRFWLHFPVRNFITSFLKGNKIHTKSFFTPKILELGLVVRYNSAPLI